MASSLTVATYTKAGVKGSSGVKLNAGVFGDLPKNHELLKLVYGAYLANGRINLAVTKTRGQVSGGGKKPWRQKGTGRARFGSSRNPIWRGGGIAFGPTGQENYTQKVPTTAKRKAIRQALSLKAQEGRIIAIETFACKDGKVADTTAYLRKIGARGRVLLVISQKDALAERATRNLAQVAVVQALYLNVYDVLNADTVVIDQKSLSMIDEWLAPTKQSAPKSAPARTAGEAA